MDKFKNVNLFLLIHRKSDLNTKLSFGSSTKANVVVLSIFFTNYIWITHLIVISNIASRWLHVCNYEKLYYEMNTKILEGASISRLQIWLGWEAPKIVEARARIGFTAFPLRRTVTEETGGPTPRISRICWRY